MQTALTSGAHDANLAAYGAGAAGSITQTDYSFLTFQEMRRVGEEIW